MFAWLFKRKPMISGIVVTLTAPICRCDDRSKLAPAISYDGMKPEGFRYQFHVRCTCGAELTMPWKKIQNVEILIGEGTT